MIAQTFLAFWCGGSLCMIISLWGELKLFPELGHRFRDFPPAAILFVIALAVVFWPFFIVWNIVRVTRLLESQKQKKVDVPAELPKIPDFSKVCVSCLHEKVRHVEGYGCNECAPDVNDKDAYRCQGVFFNPPGPDTCSLCQHDRSKHDGGGCSALIAGSAACYCHAFAVFGGAVEDCMCREWGAPHPGQHHPKCSFGVIIEQEAKPC